jgi:hypothetical protein
MYMRLKCDLLLTHALFLGHDVEKEYIRQALGSVACMVMHQSKPQSVQ